MKITLKNETIATGRLSTRIYRVVREDGRSEGTVAKYSGERVWHVETLSGSSAPSWPFPTRKAAVDYVIANAEKLDALEAEIESGGQLEAIAEVDRFANGETDKPIEEIVAKLTDNELRNVTSGARLVAESREAAGLSGARARTIEDAALAERDRREAADAIVVGDRFRALCGSWSGMIGTVESIEYDEDGTGRVVLRMSNGVAGRPLTAGELSYPFYEEVADTTPDAGSKGGSAGEIKLVANAPEVTLANVFLALARAGIVSTHVSAGELEAAIVAANMVLDRVDETNAQKVEPAGFADVVADVIEANATLAECPRFGRPDCNCTGVDRCSAYHRLASEYGTDVRSLLKSLVERASSCS